MKEPVQDRVDKIKKNESKVGVTRKNSFKSFKSFKSFQLLNLKKEGITSDTKAIQNSFLTLRFQNPEVETEFQKFYFGETLKKAKIGIAMVIGAELFGSAFDFHYLHRNDLSISNMWVLILVRYIVVAIFVAELIFAFFNKSMMERLQISIASSCLTSLLLFLYQLVYTCFKMNKEGYGFYFMAHSCLLLLYLFSFSTVQFPYAVVVSSVFCLSVLVALLAIQKLPILIVFTIVFLLIALSIVMALVNYYLETFVRKRFKVNKKISEEREKIEVEKALSQGLLLNIFPKVIIEKFKRDKATIVEEFADVTIFFSDIVSFTEMSAQKTPIQLVTLLNDLFSRFDTIVAKYKLEKIKTIGDAYMAVAGVPISDPHHAEAVANMSLEVLEAVKDFNVRNKKVTGREWNIRIGVHTGGVVAGVIGKRKYLYDLYGESVTLASTMEQTGSPARIHVSEATYQQLQNNFLFEEGKDVHFKDKDRLVKTFFLLGKKHQDEPVPNAVNDDDKVTEHLHTRMPALSLSIANPIWKALNQEINDLQNIKLNKMTLAFPLPEVEKEFHKYYFDKNLKPLRFAAMLLAVFPLLLEPFDPEVHEFPASIVIRIVRYVFLIPSCLGLFAYSFFPSFETRMQHAATAVAAILYIHWIIGGYFLQIHFCGLAFAHIATFFMLRIWMKIGFVLACVFQVVFVISAGITGFLNVLGVVTVIFAVFIYGTLASYSFERYLRMTFVNEKLFEMEAERLQIEQAKSDELLVNLLPQSIAEILKTGQETIASRLSNVTIMFVHIVGLTKLQDHLELKELFQLVNSIFCKFDDITEAHKIEKIKTIGSSYMVAAGLEHKSDQREVLKQEVHQSLQAAFDMVKFIQEFNEMQKDFAVPIDLNIRVGLHMGPVVAGVIGKKKFAYDLWGDVVNVASRMESNSTANRIQVTPKIWELMKDDYDTEERAEIDIKGKGKMKTYFVGNRKAGISPSPSILEDYVNQENSQAVRKVPSLEDDVLLDSDSSREDK